MTITRIPDPIYRTRINMIHNCSQQEAIVYLKEKGYPNTDTNDWAARLYTTGSNFLIVMPDFKDDIRSISHISHEVLHLTFRILRRAGVIFGIESEEAYTYLFDYFIDKALTALKKDISNLNT